MLPEGGLWLIFCFAALLPGVAAGEKIGGFSKSPALLSDRALPPPRANPDSNVVPQPASAPDGGKQMKEEGVASRPEPKFRMGYGNRNPKPATENKAAETAPPASETPPPVRDAAQAEKVSPPPPPPAAPDVVLPPAEAPPPTPEGVERYRVRLEERLIERYNNLPGYAGVVARVAVVLSRPLDVSLDGRLMRAEFDQLVYDHWGKRLPALEKEYYVVTFGAGGAEQVRSDPSVRIGLDMEKTYSERAPLTADPFRNVREDDTFKPAPSLKMPDWWRPEFPELD